VLVLVPSDDRAGLGYIFERAGMSAPTSISPSCRIEKVDVYPHSRQWVVHLAGDDAIGEECCEQICVAFRKILGDSCDVYIKPAAEGSGGHARPADILGCSNDPDSIDSGLLQGCWEQIARRVLDRAPSVGVWLGQARCHAADGRVIVEVPGDVQRTKLAERGCAALISDALRDIAGVRAPVSIEVGEFDALEVPGDSACMQPDVNTNAASVSRPAPSSQAPPAATEKRRGRRRRVVTDEGAIRGRRFSDAPQPLSGLIQGQKRAVVCGEVFGFEDKLTRAGLRIVSFCITDKQDSIACKCFCDPEEPPFELSEGQWARLRGDVQYDQYAREIVLVVSDIMPDSKPERRDTAEERRIELHLHTKMSAMDSVCDAESAIWQAAAWGHEAVAITDHGVVQSFPDAFAAGKKHGVKIIYGMEGYLVDDAGADDPPTYHITILARNAAGLRDLYELVSASHLKYFYRHPRLPRALLVKARSNLLIGSACAAGELFRAVLDGASDDELDRIASFYNYLEIMPAGNDEFLVRSGRLRGIDEVQAIAARIYGAGRRLGIPVVATGDVHFVEPSDEAYRRVLMAGQGYEDADHQAPLYYRTTDEMLREFAFLGERARREVVIDNPRIVAAQVECMRPVPDELATPEIEGAEDEVRTRTYVKARELYGDPLPEPVRSRLERELTSIIGNGFAVNYDIAAKLVQKSIDDGYPVGSRGSVGSSLVATMCGITEVNPLPPHYLCRDCHYSDFDHGVLVESGYDLPDSKCPRCGSKLGKEGQSIPFETFLGFDGDKVPDIDLNFSGEYQSTIHKYAEELFGADHVFRAGTIATVADKTAYGFARAYAESHRLTLRNAEISRLARGCSGVKRTTGQHPGGVMIVPKGRDVHEFTPVQHPANDRQSDIVTTHFEYKTIHDCLLKLDLLGHDDPTMIKMLEDLTGMSTGDVPMDDPATMSIFSGVEALGLDPEESGATVGTIAVPEFGTKFVRGMLEATRPRSFGELVRISGLSHGTDVWLSNAQSLIESGSARLTDVIACRDDIMNRLISDGLAPKDAFRIMERVRKGRGLADGDDQLMRDHGVPEWYIDSCNKIKYMFPKAHAAAYVTMSFRIAYFKVHHPIEFYACYFTIRASDFDSSVISMSAQDIREALSTIDANQDATGRDKSLAAIMEAVGEAKMRGITFLPVDIAKSCAARFAIENGSIRLPLVSVASLGDTAARSVVQAREERPFSSIQDLRDRTRLTRSHIDTLRDTGALAGLPETDQLSLF